MTEPGKPTVILNGQPFPYPDVIPALDEILLGAKIKHIVWSFDCYTLSINIELESGHYIGVDLRSFSPPDKEQPAA